MAAIRAALSLASTPGAGTVSAVRYGGGVGVGDGDDRLVVDDGERGGGIAERRADRGDWRA